jgi:hypothetical protein
MDVAKQANRVLKQKKRNFELDRQIKEIDQAIQQYDDLSALGDKQKYQIGITQPKSNSFDFLPIKPEKNFIEILDQVMDRYGRR